MRARDAVESTEIQGYKIADKYLSTVPNEYQTLLLSIQVQLDRINLKGKSPSGVEMLSLRDISLLALQASKIKRKG